MPAIISGVLEDSIAEELNLVMGDELLAIDGQIPQEYDPKQILQSIKGHHLRNNKNKAQQACQQGFRTNQFHVMTSFLGLW